MNIVDEIRSNGGFDSKGRISSYFVKICKQRLPILYEEILSSTSFLQYSPLLSQRIRALVLKVSYHPRCEVCDSYVMYNPRKTPTVLFSKFCSRVCASQSESRKETTRTTNRQLYGVDYHQQSTEGIEKRQQTNLIKYGSISPAANKKVRAKIEQTNLVKYGHMNVFGSDYGKQAIKSTNQLLYGADSYNSSFLSQDTLNKLSDADWLGHQNRMGKTLQDISMELNCSPSCVHKRFHKLGVPVFRQKRSLFEKSVAEWLESKGIELKYNQKIGGMEFDIFIPLHKILIECNGIYWHGENTTGRGQMYHFNKTLQGKNNGFDVIHILECDWINKNNIITSLLSNRLKLQDVEISIGDCRVTEVSVGDINTFFDNTLVQGYDDKATFAVGLLNNNKLVAGMSFAAENKQENNYQLVQFGELLHTKIENAFSVLLKYAIDKYEMSTITTSVDMRYGIGEEYSQFNFVEYTPSVSSYFKTTDCLNLIEDKNIPLSVSALVDPNLTEWENMIAGGYDRIWDCGRAKLTLSGNIFQ